MLKGKQPGRTLLKDSPSDCSAGMCGALPSTCEVSISASHAGLSHSVSQLLTGLGKAGAPAVTALPASSLSCRSPPPPHSALRAAWALFCSQLCLALSDPHALRHAGPSLHCPTRQHLLVLQDPDGRWWGCGQKETLMHCWWESDFVQPLWKTTWIFLKKLKLELH